MEQGKKLAIGLLSFALLAPLLVLFLIHVAAPSVDKQKLLSAPQIHRGLLADEVRDQLRNHTLLHIGGLHRSGTTYVWQALASHPQVSGLQKQNFTDERITGKLKKTYNEGIFLQDSYPKFGLDHDKFLLRKWIGQAAKMLPFVDEMVFSWVRLREGVGRFATDPRHHLDESSPLVADVTQHRLFNQWANFWDLDKPMLLEKSPSNIVISPFLHRLWGLGLSSSPAKFIFMRRHPLAVALATQKAGGHFVSDLTVVDLVENWVLAEERLARDLQQYFQMAAGSTNAEGTIYKIVRFEDTVQQPRQILEDLLTWLGLPILDIADTFEEGTKKDPNLKYFATFCVAMVNKDKVANHLMKIVERFDERIRKIEPRYAPRDIPKLCREDIFKRKAGAEKADEEQSQEL